MPDEVAQIGLVVEIGRQQTLWAQFGVRAHCRVPECSLRKAITVLRKASAVARLRSPG